MNRSPIKADYDRNKRAKYGPSTPSGKVLDNLVLQESESLENRKARLRKERSTTTGDKKKQQRRIEELMAKIEAAANEMDVKLPHVRNRRMFSPIRGSQTSEDSNRADISPINTKSSNRMKNNIQKSKSQDQFSLPPTEVSFKHKNRNSSPKHIPVRISLVYPHVLKPPEHKRAETLSNDEIYKTEENFVDSERSNTPINAIKEEEEEENNNNNNNGNDNNSEDVVIVKEEEIKEEEVDNFPEDFQDLPSIDSFSPSRPRVSFVEINKMEASAFNEKRTNGIKQRSEEAVKRASIVKERRSSMLEERHKSILERIEQKEKHRIYVLHIRELRPAFKKWFEYITYYYAFYQLTKVIIPYGKEKHLRYDTAIKIQRWFRLWTRRRAEKCDAIKLLFEGPKRILRHGMRRFKKKKSAEIIYSFLYGIQFQNTFTTQVVESMQKIRRGQRLIRRHFAVRKARYKCVCKMYEKAVEEYIKETQMQKNTQNSRLKQSRLADESIYIETDKMLKKGALRDKDKQEEYNKLRMLNYQLMQKHHHLVELFGKKKTIEKVLAKPKQNTFKVRSSIRDSILRPYFTDICYLYFKSAQEEYRNEMAVYNAGIRKLSLNELLTVGFDPLKWMEMQNTRRTVPKFKRFYIWRYVDKKQLRELVKKGIELEKEQRKKESELLPKDSTVEAEQVTSTLIEENTSLPPV